MCDGNLAKYCLHATVTHDFEMQGKLSEDDLKIL